MNLIPYKPEHAIEVIQDGPNEPNLGLCNLTIEQAQEKAKHGPCFSGEHDGRIVGCGGITIPYEGFGEAWAVYVHDIGQHHIDPNIARNAFYDMILEKNIVRCQTKLRTDFPTGVTYAEWLGFKFEAQLEKYFPDHTDAFMYKIIGD